MDHPVAAAGHQPIIVQAGFRSAHRIFSLIAVVYNITRSDSLKPRSHRARRVLPTRRARCERGLSRMTSYPCGRTSKTALPRQFYAEKKAAD